MKGAINWPPPPQKKLPSKSPALLGLIEHVPDDKSNLPNIDDPILKVIVKYENHLSILRIKNYMKEKDLYFSFEFLDKPKVSKEKNKLDRKKACQEHHIPVKFIKSNKDLFSHFKYHNFKYHNFKYHNFNNSFSNFPSNLKAADILQIRKKKTSQILRTIVQLVLFLRSLRYMKDVCMTKYI